MSGNGFLRGFADAAPSLVLVGKYGTDGKSPRVSVRTNQKSQETFRLSPKFQERDAERQQDKREVHRCARRTLTLLELNRFFRIAERGHDVLCHLCDQLVSPERISYVVVDHPHVPDVEGYVRLIR